MEEAIIAAIVVALILFVVPFVVYGTAASFFGLKVPQEASPLRFLQRGSTHRMGVRVARLSPVHRR